jgi:phenylacetate-coenzyme A ligase PaaK-like adenylate-forming protein
MLRYRNGDLAVAEDGTEPGCSISFSRIKAVSGRETDIISLPDGGMLSVPSFFGSMLLKKVKGLKQYQVEKLEDDLLCINLVRTESFGDDDMAVMEAALRDYLNGRIRYVVKFVERIDVSGTGKFKLVIDRTTGRGGAG